MTSQKIESFSLSSGLHVVVEPMSGVESAAVTLMIPAGALGGLFADYHLRLLSSRRQQ